MNDNKTIVKRITDELSDFSKASLKIKIFTIVFILLSFFILYNEAFRVPVYKDKILDLEKENQETEIQLIPFKTIALEKFTGDENQRLQKLAQEITNIQRDVIALRDYSDVAGINAYGKPYNDGDIIFNTPISILLEGTWEDTNGQITIKKDIEAENKYRQVIGKFPKFPFSYYFVALCLKNRDDEARKDYANKAIKILEITTSIAKHHPHHDDVLRRLYRHLNEK